VTQPLVFSYDRFLSLSGCELVDYVEPFVTTRVRAIPESVYDVLRSALTGLDEAHTVYALEICMLLKPREFVRCAVRFLSDSNASVCCTAYRIIKSLPPTSMPAELVREICATPSVDLFASDVCSGDRIHIGTNEEFIRDLIATFAER